MNRFTKRTYNSSGSWLCPAGVTQILVWGMGGGSSGSAGNAGSAGAGGSSGRGGVGQNLQATLLTVVPNTSYTITIGDGGAASATVIGNAGSDTTFGALMTWKGAPARANVVGGDSYGIFRYRTIVTASNQSAYASGDSQNTSGTSTAKFGYPARNSLSAALGTSLNVSTAGAPGGGGMGGEGLGGAGGIPANNLPGGNGFDAAANTGGGGGAGAGGGATSKAAGNGGAGGSGQIIVMWVE